MHLEQLRVVFRHLSQNLAEEEEKQRGSSNSPPVRNRVTNDDAKNQGQADSGRFAANQQVRTVRAFVEGRAIQARVLHD